MSELERCSVRVLAPLAIALALLAPAAAAAEVPIHCDDFEAGVPCAWNVGPSCTGTICSVGGTCAGDFCECTPASAFAFLAGDWSGTWEDTQYNVGGTLTATFEVTCKTVEATGVIGLQELALGEESGSGSGTISGSTLSFTFAAATVGSGDGTLEAGVGGSGTGTVTGSLDFGAFTFAGTAAPAGISGTFDFTSPTGGEGVASLTKD